MKVRGLNHVAYRCNDAAETVAFYTDLLGLRLAHTIVQDRVPSTGQLDPHCHVFFEMGDGSWVAFFDLSGEAQVEQQGNPDWAQHLALEVGSIDELTDAQHRLEAAGVDVLGPVDHGFIRSIYFYDPSGHRLELTTRTHDGADLESFALAAQGVVDDWTASKRPGVA